jgi:hypothetical protein
MDPNAVLLDERHSKGLIRQALLEGYANLLVSSEREDSELADIDRQILIGYKRSKLSSKALTYLLL